VEWENILDAARLEKICSVCSVVDPCYERKCVFPCGTHPVAGRRRLSDGMFGNPTKFGNQLVNNSRVHMVKISSESVVFKHLRGIDQHECWFHRGFYSEKWRWRM